MEFRKPCRFSLPCLTGYGFPDGSVVKNLPLMQEMQVQSLGQEDLLEKEMATHCSVLAKRILWTEEPAGLLSRGVAKESDMTEQLNNSKNRVSCK